MDEADDSLDDTTREIVAEFRHIARKVSTPRIKHYLGADTATGDAPTK